MNVIDRLSKTDVIAHLSEIEETAVCGGSEVSFSESISLTKPGVQAFARTTVSGSGAFFQGSYSSELSISTASKGRSPRSRSRKGETHQRYFFFEFSPHAHAL